MASVEYETPEQGRLRLVISGRLDAEAVSFLWPGVFKKLARISPRTLQIDASDVAYCDGAGIGFLFELKHEQHRRNGKIEIEGLKPEFSELMAMFDLAPTPTPAHRPGLPTRIAESIGKAAVGLRNDLRAQISFTGEVFAKLLYTLLHPGSLRCRDTLLIAEKSGANAVGIVALLGFLIGLILAFQSAVAMRKFGAEIFIADVVTMSLFRELGPLLTAFIIASRSGSAFAAELGTMKVNEEIDALTTMGLDPVRFLVIPRIIAVVLVTPLLTMFHNLLGLIGCGLVMISIGFTPVAFFNQVRQAAMLGDVFGGLAKTFVFGLLIGGIGCLRGLETGSSASAVGDSATRAVVSSIVAIVIADGIFAVVYYFLGI